MRRTTVRLDDELLTRAKAFALARGVTLQSVIEDGVRLVLGREVAADRRRPRIVTFKGDGVRPGIDLDNNAALLELMEGDRHRPV